MRFTGLDLLFMMVCVAAGVAGFIGVLHAMDVEARALPRYLLLGLSFLSGLAVYLVLIYPVYKGLALWPLVLPRCPCCRNYRDLFELSGSWPRVTFRCCKCNGEFVVWVNGKVGVEETWDKPVLSLKWPYALGVYRLENRPEGDVPQGRGPTTRAIEGTPGVNCDER